VVESLGAQPRDAGNRVAAHQQLQHLVEQARRRDVLDQDPHPVDRLARRFVDLEPELGAKRTARSIRTGSSR